MCKIFDVAYKILVDSFSISTIMISDVSLLFRMKRAGKNLKNEGPCKKCSCWSDKFRIESENTLSVVLLDKIINVFKSENMFILCK